MPERATIYTYPWDLSDEGVDRIAATTGGIDGFAFYNYGLMRQAHLEWIGASRDAWS